MQKKVKLVTSKKIPCEKYFTPPCSVMSRTHITNKNLELRLLAGVMEKLRYKMTVKKSNFKPKHPYRILSNEPYTPTEVTDYHFLDGKFSGRYGPFGGEGYGEYQFPDGIIYRGNISNSMFSGDGILTFPNGGTLQAYWIQGVAFNPKYKFHDGLQYEHEHWPYCKIPDRRFFSEYEKDINPSGNTQLANDHPARTIPLASYDTGEGFYNPFTRELIHPITGEFIRIPSEQERHWILNHCRREWITPLPFDPEIYENWFPEFNEERLKNKRPFFWEAVNQSIGERTGMVGKIKSITGYKLNVLHTDPALLSGVNDFLAKRNDTKLDTSKYIG